MRRGTIPCPSLSFTGKLLAIVASALTCDTDSAPVPIQKAQAWASHLQEDLIQTGCKSTSPHTYRDRQGPRSEPGSSPVSLPASKSRLTLQVTDAGFWPGLQQPAHEELRTKEFRGNISPVLGETNLIGGELAPLWGEESNQGPDDWAGILPSQTQQFHHSPTSLLVSTSRLYLIAQSPPPSYHHLPVSSH